MNRNEAEWHTHPNGVNENLEVKGVPFYISYAPSIDAVSAKAPDAAASREKLEAIQKTSIKGDIANTALCVNIVPGVLETYYVLEGDFREEFKQPFKDGLQACFDFVEENLDKLSPASIKFDKSLNKLMTDVVDFERLA